jgi:nucleoside-diphosphate-sugar epimerase
LRPGAPHAGRAYFIAQEQPVVLWSWIADVLQRLGIEPPSNNVPEWLAYSVGAVLETAWRALPLRGEPPMTRFIAQQLARTHTYDMAPARRDFGYVERIGLEEATERTVGWLGGQTMGTSGGAGTGAPGTRAIHERA